MRKNVGKLGAIVAGLGALYSCTATNPRGNSPPEIYVDGTRADNIPSLVYQNVDLPIVHGVEIIDIEWNKINYSHLTGENSNLDVNTFNEKRFPGSKGSVVSYRLEISKKDINEEVPDNIDVIIKATDNKHKGKNKGDSLAKIIYKTVDGDSGDNDNADNLNDNLYGNDNFIFDNDNGIANDNYTTNDNDVYDNDNFFDNDNNDYGNVNDNYGGNVNENNGEDNENNNMNQNGNVNDNAGGNQNQNENTNSNMNDNSGGNGNENVNENQNDNTNGNMNQNENDNTPSDCELNDILRTDYGFKEMQLYSDSCGTNELACLDTHTYCDTNSLTTNVGQPFDVYVSVDLFCGDNVTYSAFLDDSAPNTAGSLVELIESIDGRAHFRFTPTELGTDWYIIRTVSHLIHDEFLEVNGE